MATEGSGAAAPRTPTIAWMRPAACLPPHRVAEPEKVAALRDAFGAAGWDPSCPALVGYPSGEHIQLLSGSHRWRAAVESGIDAIPVVIRDFEQCYSAFGNLRRWRRLMAAPPSGPRAAPPAAESPEK